MFILVKRNCLSAHGKIFRRGEVVELDDETGKALLASEDYTEVVLQESEAEKAAEEPAEEPAKTPVKAPARGKGKTTKGKGAATKKAESEDALPAPDVEGTVEG